MRTTLFVLFAAVAIVAFGAVAHADGTPEPAPEQTQPQQDEPSWQQEPAADETVAADAESPARLPEPAPGQNLDPSALQIFAAGQSCGGATCGFGEYCCNPSCSLCVPFGMSCTQQSCN